MMSRLITVSLCFIIVQCSFLYVAGCESYLRLVTYNAGLTSSVGQYEARRRETGPAVAELNADVVCLQEIWYSSDMEQILGAIGPSAHTYSALHDVTDHMTPVSPLASPCMSSSFLISFMPCLTWRCDVHSSDRATLLDCAERQCGLMELDQQCITCLIISERASLFNSCFSNMGNQVNIPGLLLVSKRPLVNARLTYYRNETLLLPRARITAEVDGVGTVVCTHLTTDVGPTYFERKINDFSLKVYFASKVYFAMLMKWATALSDVSLADFLTTKYALWLDMRASDDDQMHGSGRQVENASEGVTIQITKEADGAGTLKSATALSGVPKLPYDSWESQNLAESRVLVSSLEHVQHAVVMGDTNSGPRVPHSDVHSSFTAGYNHITGHGFDTQYVEWVAVCTYCSYNALSDGSASAILDHVFTRGLTVRGTRRVFDGATMPGGYAMSDHYGIEVIIEATTE